MKVALVGRDGETGIAAAGEVGHGASFIQGDLCDADFRGKLPSLAEEALAGSIDISW